MLEIFSLNCPFNFEKAAQGLSALTRGRLIIIPCLFILKQPCWVFPRSVWMNRGSQWESMSGPNPSGC